MAGATLRWLSVPPALDGRFDIQGSHTTQPCFFGNEERGEPFFHPSRLPRLVAPWGTQSFPTETESVVASLDLAAKRLSPSSREIGAVERAAPSAPDASPLLRRAWEPEMNCLAASPF